MTTELAIARRAFRQLRVGAVVCAVAFGLTVASSATTYASSFPTPASRQQLAASVGGDVGFAVLFGPVDRIDTVGGYAAYKSFVFLTSIGAVWAALAATRVLRGEEDAGRWQLVLAGRTRAARATVATTAALGLAVAIVFAGTAVLTALAGRDPKVGLGVGGSLLYAASLAVAPAVFGAVGAVTSQLGRSRRVASALALGVVGASFVVRMVADAGPSTRWLLWATPFGWTERIRPFTEDDPRPLVVAALAVAALVAAAAVLAGRRDVGDGTFSSADAAPPRTAGLGSPFGLAVRLERASILGWFAGVAATGLILGSLSEITTHPAPASMSGMLDRFALQGAFLDQFLGISFLFLASLAALLAASQVGAAGEEEESGRLVHALGGTTGRTAWFAGRLALAAVAVVAASVLGGGATWVGARARGVPVGAGELLGAGLNVAPSALVALGVGALSLALAPAVAGRVVYALVAWSLIADVVGALVSGTGWLAQLSLFHHMALAPAQGVDPVTLVATLAVAGGLAAVATAAFARRDLDAG
ncbi:MAG: hypothetical protein KF703_17555 [Actinobacteria bacterium]|nr:hypothetical protein [Actinomycetota bacterium]